MNDVIEMPERRYVRIGNEITCHRLIPAGDTAFLGDIIFQIVLDTEDQAKTLMGDINRGE